MKYLPVLALCLPLLTTHAAESGIASAGDVRSKAADWPPEVQQVTIDGASDGLAQPALYYASPSTEPAPLLVFLHPWSSNYMYATGIDFSKACIAQGWSFIQPDFHGPNHDPKALGSEFVVADVKNAIAYAQAHSKVDPKRIYLVGASGGGHAALLMAGRLPGVFAAISAWVPISDVAAWYHQTKDTKDNKYAADIAKVCGAAPDPGTSAEKDALSRSPLTYLAQTKGTPTRIDINTGIHDGHAGGSVPVSQSLLAFNLLAEPADRIPEADIERMVKEEAVPAELLFTGTDPAYDKRKVLFRKSSGPYRITVTNGRHEIVTPAALAWITEQDQHRPSSP